MKRSASPLLSGASSPKIDPDHSKAILDDAIAVFQRLIDLGCGTVNVLEFSAAGQIGVQIVEIINVRPTTPLYETRN